MFARHRSIPVALTVLFVGAQCGEVAVAVAAPARVAPEVSAFALSALVAPELLPVAPAKPGAKSASPVARALGYYREARYDEAVGLLSGPVLRKELVGDELRDARLVLARCYVKKGITGRAKEYFSTILAADPTFVPAKGALDTEEQALFDSVKGVPSGPPAPAAGKPAAPDAKPAPSTPPAKEPTLHKPATTSSSDAKPGWFSKNKYYVIAAAVGGGTVAALAGSSGGGSSKPTPPTTLGPFPQPPTR